MDRDVDAFFAQHDIPSVVSDLLFELGFHRPKDVGRFIAGYVERRFRLEGEAAAEAGGAAPSEGAVQDTDYTTLEVRPAPAAMGSDEVLACALLEEARALRGKYSSFLPQSMFKKASASGRASQEALQQLGDGFARQTSTGSVTSDSGEARRSPSKTTFGIIPWSEFKADYERFLAIVSNAQVWRFCERRLRQLCSLFDAHCALNADLEEAEAAGQWPPPLRVDGVVQIARSLPSARLMAYYSRQLADSAAGDGAGESGRLGDLVNRLGRPPGPADLAADTDAPAPLASSLCGAFSRTSGSNRGRFLAETAGASFALLETSGAATGGETFAEFRLPLQADSGAWLDLARWASEFRVRSPRAKWVIQLHQAAYAEMKERRSVLSFGELLDNAFGPPAASASASAPADTEASQLQELLADVAGVEVATATVATEALPPDEQREPSEWTCAASPPAAYQIYHVWARLKALNGCRGRVNLPALPLTVSANNAEPIACAYLLGARGVSRCAALAAHEPLRYLFVLDEVVAHVSLGSRRSLGGVGCEAASQALGRLFKAGVPLALCTEDPTVSHHGDDPLSAEYALARSLLGLSSADLAELARRSVAGSSWGGRAEQKSIRERYRKGRREAEDALLTRLAPRAAAAAQGARPADAAN